MASKTRGREIFESRLSVIKEQIARTAANHWLDPEESEDFFSFVMLKLIENDYARLGKFQGASSLPTFLHTVIGRLLLDFRCQKWGKWRPSSRARQLGPTATLLESLLYRDGFSFPEAAGILCQNHGLSVSTDELQQLRDLCPVRPRRRFVSEEAIENLPSPGAPDEVLYEVMGPRMGKLESEVNAALQQLSQEDRHIVAMHYEGGLSLLQIARVLGREPKGLYRRMHKILRRLRDLLESHGVDRDEVCEVLGAPRLEMHFRYSRGTTERLAERSLHA